MVLIDSIARRVPINAITLYKQTDKSGVVIYEVIDGKQRLSAVLQFKQGKISPLSDSLKGLSEEEEAEGEELANKILDKKWDELDVATRNTFLDYEVPIYIVEGSRASAVRAFRRMNADPYALNPQEIRNAVFKDSQFLKATRKLAENVDKFAVGSDHFLVEWGLMNQTQWDRMKDLQFLSELLCLQIFGPQEARRTLDDTYDSYSNPGRNNLKKLEIASGQTENVIKAIKIILGGSLKPHCFDNENDLYCFVGALFNRGIPSGPQLADSDLMEDLRETISLFRNQVLLYQEAVKENDEDQIARYGEDVKNYGATLLGGQINSAKRRQDRIDILKKVINDRVTPVDFRKPSDLQRRLVWAKSADKKCARCGKKVEWKDYDCGHDDPRAFGGRAVVANLRVEHLTCNRAAKAN